MKRAATTFLCSIAVAGCGGVPTASTAPVSAPAATTHGGTRHNSARAKWIWIGGNDAQTTGFYGAPEVAVYSAAATGNVAPVRSIKGSNTGFIALSGVAISSDGSIWACDFDASRLFKFSSSAIGNATPVTALGPGAKTLNGCSGIAISSSGTIFASSFGLDTGYVSTIFAWKAGATGNAAPVKTISGAATKLHGPQSLAFDSNGNLTAVNQNQTVEVFAPTANGNVAPLRKIAGAATALQDPAGVAIDPATNTIWVSNAQGNSLLEFAHLANGNAAPMVTIAGSKTHLNSPFGIAVDGAGYIYVANCPQAATTPPNIGSIEVFEPGSSGNVAPVQRIVGTAADLSCAGSLTLSGTAHT
jgi:DNA-binding beta-propeller fold protein YncE